MLKRRIKSLLGLAILSVSMASALSSCTSNNTSNQTEEKVIQTLNGFGSINDTNYDFELRILEADNEFYIKTLNTEYENIWGEWTFTEGKGYILTFDDAYWTEKKVKYNEDSKEFFFTYEVNLGSAVGKLKSNSLDLLITSLMMEKDGDLSHSNSLLLISMSWE